jgi:parallel beta-helix repeat protein
MRTERIASLAITALLVSAAILTVITYTLPTQAQARGALTVCSSGCSYSTLQAAIDAASPSQTISLYSGTYQEQVIITKDLRIVGTKVGGEGFPIIQAPPTLAADPLCSVVPQPVESTVLSVTVYPTTINQGAALIWVATGVTPKGVVQVWVNNIQLVYKPSLTASASGIVWGYFIVGTAVPVGTATLKVTDVTTGKSATANFDVTLNSLTNKCYYPPSYIMRDIVSIGNSASVKISNVIISGPSTNITSGISLYQHASLILTNSEITMISGTDANNGIGLQVGANSSLGIGMSEVGYATLANVNINQYSYLGIMVGGYGSSLNVAGSSISGSASGQVGILVQDLASATISGDTVQFNTYGIIVYNASASITKNKVSDSTWPVGSAGGGSNLETGYQGVGIYLSNAGALPTLTPSVVEGNTIKSSDIGIYAYDTNGINSQTIASNQITEQSPAGPTYYGVVLRDSNLTLYGNSFKGGLYGVAVVADSQNTGVTLWKNNFSYQKTGSLLTWALPPYQVTVNLK